MSKLSEFAEFVKEVMAAHPKGRRFVGSKFYPDPTPIAPPVGYKAAPSLSEQIRAMVRSEKLRQEAEAAGFESFEESDDFEVGDDYDPRSPFEEHFFGEFDEKPVAAADASKTASPAEGVGAEAGASQKPAPAPVPAPEVKSSSTST